MKQKIQVKYYHRVEPALGYKIYYTLDAEAETYEGAIQCLTYIMNACNGVITHTQIDIIEQTIAERMRQDIKK